MSERTRTTATSVPLQRVGLARLSRWLLGGSRREARLRRATLLAIGAGTLLIAWAAFFNPFQFLQNAFTDTLFVEGQGSGNIVIVSIEEETLDRYGRLREWPRSLHAEAIQQLSQAGAQVIVYDILFADEGADDQVLVEAVSRAGNVVLPVAGAILAGAADDAPYRYETLTRPLGELEQAAAAVGHATLVTDGDGQVRRIPLATEDADGEQYLTLALAAFYLQFGRELPSSLPLDGDTLPLLGRNVPLEEFQTMRINYTGGQQSFGNISFDDVVAGKIDSSFVNGKVALVGVIAASADRHSAPLLGDAAGVEIHANTLDTLFSSRFLRPSSGWVDTLVALAFVVFTGLIVTRWRVGYAVIAIVVLLIAYEGLGIVLFYEGRIVNYVDPPAAAMLAAAVGLVYRSLAERAAQQEVRELFGRYVSADLAGELVRRADRGELTMGGETRELTILFADIRGFTPLSERLAPDELVTLLNEQFDVIISNISTSHGIVNKFLGDAVLAFWNAPHDQSDHALLACRAALASLDELDNIEQTDPPIRWGFAITTGFVLAGNVGASGRLEYTVIGEAVNTASRLSGQARGGELWVGERTYELVQDHFDAEKLPPQTLKGVSGPVTVYRLKRGEPTPARETMKVRT